MVQANTKPLNQDHPDPLLLQTKEVRYTQIAEYRNRASGTMAWYRRGQSGTKPWYRPKRSKNTPHHCREKCGSKQVGCSCRAMCLYAQIAEYRNRASGTMAWYRRGQSGTKPWYRPKRSKNTPHHCREKCGSKQVGCSCRAMYLYAQIAEYRNRASGTMAWYRRGQSGTKPWYRPKRSKNTPHHCGEKCGSKQVGCSCRAMCLYAQIAEYRNRASGTMAWYRRGQSGTKPWYRPKRSKNTPHHCREKCGSKQVGCSCRAMCLYAQIAEYRNRASGTMAWYRRGQSGTKPWYRPKRSKNTPHHCREKCGSKQVGCSCRAMCLYAQIAEYRNRASGTMPWYRRGQSGTKPWYRPKRSKHTPHHCREKCGSKQVSCSCRAMCLYAQIAEYRNRASGTMAWYRRGQSGTKPWYRPKRSKNTPHHCGEKCGSKQVGCSCRAMIQKHTTSCLYAQIAEYRNRASGTMAWYRRGQSGTKPWYRPKRSKNTPHHCREKCGSKQVGCSCRAMCLYAQIAEYRNRASGTMPWYRRGQSGTKPWYRPKRSKHTPHHCREKCGGKQVSCSCRAMCLYAQIAEYRNRASGTMAWYRRGQSGTKPWYRPKRSKNTPHHCREKL